MKKYILIVIFILLFLFPINVSAEWVLTNNPVLSPSLDSWDNNNVSSPFVLKVNNTYKMWYQADINGFWSIGYATSENGITWNRYPSPIISPEYNLFFNEQDVAEPSVVVKDKYYLFYDSRDNNYMQRIRLATSEDGINWTKHSGYVLKGIENWEKDGVTDPSVIYHDGKFRMFYGAWGNPHVWQIGYAESEDGINWTRPLSNPLDLPSLGHLNGPHIDFYDGKYQLYYHTGGVNGSNTIYHVSSSDLVNWQCGEGCSILEAGTNGLNFDRLVGPSYLNDGNRLLLYYGFAGSGPWQIGLATNQISEPSSKLIIIPGLFASWNKQAIIYNDPVDFTDWELNPIVSDYNGLFETLNNLGLQENSDYYIFNYDWRKDVNSITADLDSYLIAHNLDNVPVKFVGHSLGGLVARVYAQKYPSQNIKQIVTVGSPHQGVAQVYKAIAGGEMEESDNLRWLAEKLAIQLYRTGLETDREILNQHFPILRNLLATYPYLYGQNNQEINYDDYDFKNNLLPGYNSFSELDNVLTSIIGEKGDTIYAYKLGQRTTLDKLLNNYPEGRPQESRLQIGDYVVPGFSAKTGNFQTLPLDHGELVYKKQGIGKILETLGIEYQSEDLVSSDGTQIFPSLIFLIMSPIELQVEINNQVYQEHEGIVFIKNPVNGKYLLKAKGKDNGKYTILVGSLTRNTDQWYRINGTIDSTNPQSEIDEYQVEINDNKLLINNNLLINQIISDLMAVNNEVHSNKLALALKYLKNPKLQKQKFILLKVQNFLIQAISKVPKQYKHRLLTITDQIETYYLSFNFKYNKKTLSKYLVLRYKLLNGLYTFKENLLLLKQKRRFDIQDSAYLLSLVKTKLIIAKNALTNKDYNLAEINLNTSAGLLHSIN